MFADQAAENLPSHDPRGVVDSVARFLQWRSLLKRLVRPVGSKVPDVLGQNVAEISLAEDQQLIQALAAKRAATGLGS